jgi:hypothetical protein
LTETTDVALNAEELGAIRWLPRDPGCGGDLGLKLGVRPVLGPFIRAEHRGFTEGEAWKVEAVRDVVIQRGLIQWKSVEIINVVAQEEALNVITGPKACLLTRTGGPANAQRSLGLQN